MYVSVSEERRRDAGMERKTLRASVCVCECVSAGKSASACVGAHVAL